MTEDMCQINCHQFNLSSVSCRVFSHPHYPRVGIYPSPTTWRRSKHPPTGFLSHGAQYSQQGTVTLKGKIWFVRDEKKSYSSMYTTQTHTACEQMHSLSMALTFYEGLLRKKSLQKMRNTDVVYSGDLWSAMA